MSERTVRVNGVCLTESQVREAYAELARGDAAAIESQVCVTQWRDQLYLSAPIFGLQTALARVREKQTVLQVRLKDASLGWFPTDPVLIKDRLVLSWPEIVQRLTEG